jgi:hypothetical protein
MKRRKNDNTKPKEGKIDERNTKVQKDRKTGNKYKGKGHHMT